MGFGPPRENPLQPFDELHKLKNRIDSDFTYHPPKAGQPAMYEELRKRARVLAHFIADNTPVSREQSLALTKLEEAIYWANAALARHE